MKQPTFNLNALTSLSLASFIVLTTAQAAPTYAPEGVQLSSSTGTNAPILRPIIGNGAELYGALAGGIRLSNFQFSHYTGSDMNAIMTDGRGAQLSATGWYRIAVTPVTSTVSPLSKSTGHALITVRDFDLTSGGALTFLVSQTAGELNTAAVTLLSNSTVGTTQTFTDFRLVKLANSQMAFDIRFTLPSGGAARHVTSSVVNFGDETTASTTSTIASNTGWSAQPWTNITTAPAVADTKAVTVTGMLFGVLRPGAPVSGAGQMTSFNTAGNLTAAAVTATNLTTSGTITSTGVINANGGLTLPAGSALSAAGGLTIPATKTLVANGTSTLSGATTIGAAGSTARNLTVNGTSLFTGAIAANDGLTVAGDIKQTTVGTPLKANTSLTGSTVNIGTPNAGVVRTGNFAAGASSVDLTSVINNQPASYNTALGESSIYSEGSYQMTSNLAAGKSKIFSRASSVSGPSEISFATALGNSSVEGASYATALGNATIAREASFALAAGRGVKANGESAAVVGKFNAPLATASDELFIVGNGSSDTARANALVLTKAGNLGLGTGNANPAKRLVVVGDGEVSGTLVIGAPTPGVTVPNTSKHRLHGETFIERVPPRGGISMGVFQ